MTPVVFHDDEVDRITTGVGKMTSISHSNLKKLNLATKHPLSAEYNHHVVVPDLDEFVAECVKLNMKMIIDLKTYESVEETTKTVLELYTKFPGMRTMTIVTSFFPTLLYSLRSRNADIVCSVSTRPHFFASTSFDGTIESLKPRFSGIQQSIARLADIIYPWLLKHVIWDFVGISAVLVHKAVVTPQYVSAWRQKGVRVIAWTVNDPLEKAHLRYNLGVQCLTDTLERVKPDNWILRE
jgi:glycerophosphoinositol glycerophosphodiesterase